MGHDIYGINKAGKEIAYARFNMWNSNASILYNLLDSIKFHAGVSGSGEESTYTTQQIEKALSDYFEIYGRGSANSKNSFDDYDLTQIHDFIQKCLLTSQEEGSVRVYFG
ncbi:MAG: hypothetical protein K0S34_1242 [Bacillales bacterium]|jgi:hypothetical protein|nr:hypothetical protein [Bacillales bacterium]